MSDGSDYELFGTYRLTHLLGKGGMASVYRALRSGPMGFAKEVAIKRLHEALAEDEKILKALINEARLGGQLKHPNIVEIYEFNKIDGKYFLAMEFVDGWTIDRILEFAKQYKQPMPPEVVLDVFAQVCDGLHYAHTLESLDGQDVKLVHRDIKPANIMVSRFGISKIMDFGIAKAATNLFQTTVVAPEHKTTKGTPHYMSPEQVAGDPDIGFPSDIFSLGSVIYEAVTGEVLFKGDNLATVLFAVVKADVGNKLDALDEHIPGLAQVIARCLEKSPDDRFQNVALLGEELLRLRDQMPGQSSIQDYLYALRGYLVGSHTDRQEKSTLVSEIPEFATLFGQLQQPEPRKSKQETAALDEAIEAAERSIREGIHVRGDVVDSAAPTMLEAPAVADHGTVRSTAPSPPGQAHPDLRKTALTPSAPAPKAPKKKRRRREGVSAKTRVHPPGQSPGERVEAARKKRSLWLLAAAVIFSLGVAAAAVLSFLGVDAPPPTTAKTIAAPPPLQPSATLEAPAAFEATTKPVPDLTPGSDLTPAPRPSRRVERAVDATLALSTEVNTPTPPEDAPPAAEETEATQSTGSPDSTAATSAAVGQADPRVSVAVEPRVPTKPGQLSIKASKPWASVLVDGEDIGKTTPLIGYRLASGTHDIELVGSENAGRVRRTITVDAGGKLVLPSYNFATNNWSE